MDAVGALPCPLGVPHYTLRAYGPLCSSLQRAQPNTAQARSAEESLLLRAAIKQ